jgi:hypothetical protein
MSDALVLPAIELVPVIELEPYHFATQERTFPCGTAKEELDQRCCYWRDSLADSAVTNLRPIRPGSWHVPTAEFTNLATLRAVLDVLLRDSGGIDALSAPDTIPVLSGGLALRVPSGEVLVEPGCCADLGGLRDWQVATTYRSSGWQMVWTGHPWVSVRYEEPWLVLSPPHESDSPVGGWAFRPEQLERAGAEAETELEWFAGRLEVVLPLLGFQGEPGPVARRMAGLGD